MAMAASRLRWVVHSRLPEPLLPEDTRVAVAAGPPVRRRIVAAPRDPIVHPQPLPQLHDLRLAEADQWGMDPEKPPLDAGAGGEVRHPLEGLDVLRPAVRVAAVVQGICADEDVGRLQYFGPAHGEGEEDGVPGGDVRRRDPVADTIERRVLG